MALAEASRIGRRGVVVIPARLRKEYNLSEGDYVMVESSQAGILLKPARIVPIERYTDARRAEFLLGNATTPREYANAVAAVKKMGLNPKKIPHMKPHGK